MPAGAVGEHDDGARSAGAAEYFGAGQRSTLLFFLKSAKCASEEEGHGGGGRGDREREFISNGRENVHT